ncbi:fasciclin domain-containing protein [Armatimonas rosea]|uniref:Putative surface protein with fasciclin (FAS1) repeats n=1 Tax=Armatimonas rosea TaxID=685828 RepID=A0A7W9W7J1_ARMRO|nr:fasciclin domain-containing protein [Armatimonas rosea]MBB6050672.1 putative surface protein with fasciclin (FAS1) repeats [Armatimonas rosea]
MDTNFRSRLLRVLLASAIIGSVAGWLYPHRSNAQAACFPLGADSYIDQAGCLDLSQAEKNQRLAGAALAAYGVYRASTGGIHLPAHTGSVRTGSASLWGLTQSKPDEFGALIKILRNTGETETYQSSGPYTVFWPTDAALTKALGAERVAALQSPAGQQDARHFIASLTVSGSYSLQRLRALATEGKTLTTLTGDEVVLKLEGNTLTANGVALLQSEYPAQNGFVLVTEGIVAREP